MDNTPKDVSNKESNKKEENKRTEVKQPKTENYVSQVASTFSKLEKPVDKVVVETKTTKTVHQGIATIIKVTLLKKVRKHY